MTDKIVIIVLLISYFVLKRKCRYQISLCLDLLVMLVFYNHKTIEFELLQFVLLLSGYFLAPVLTVLTNLLVKHVLLGLTFAFKPESLHVITGVWEEIIWRNIILALVYKYFDLFTSTHCNVLFAIILTSMLFVGVHKFKSISDYVEMFVYSLCLSYSAHYIPYLNIGLHIGRNCFILKMMKETRNEE